MAREHAALINNLVHKKNVVVFEEIKPAKKWSRGARGFELGMDLIIFSDDDELKKECEALNYVVKN